MRRLLIALAAMAAVLLPGAPAWAHNELTDASPAADSTLSTAPTTVRLAFRQPLKPEFTTIVVSTAARQRVPAGDPTAAGDTTTLTLNQGLANGVYTVAYRTVSVDGHVVQGAYTFTVADPAKPAALTSSAATTSSTATRADRIPAPILTSSAILGVGLAVLAAAFYWRRRRRLIGPASAATRYSTPHASGDVTDD